MVLEIFQVLWFILIAVLFIGFFFLEGYDYGVLILLPFLGKGDRERRIVIESIGPFWEGNEVWLVTAGGALFATFPGWYATMFSTFYLPLFLILVALILRVVAFEFRGKLSNPKWRTRWDFGLFLGSLIPALLWGVAFSNMLKGLPIDSNFNYTGGFFNLLTPACLLTGIVGLLFFIYHGGVFLMIRTVGDLYDKSKKAAIITGGLTIIFAVILVFYGLFAFSARVNLIALGCAVILALLLIASLVLVVLGRPGLAFLMNLLGVFFGVAAWFAAMFPNVMISSTTSANNLTIFNASSNLHSLIVITIVTVILLPIILLYQGWCYKTFMGKITGEKLHY
ncbi:MAG: cytochrome d ubiquinol oxidase subunit II [Fusobacteria bacterium]|nr:cytochrome d ubiquinol oxidase subunit II [Fusobacteriota bacterium]